MDAKPYSPEQKLGKAFLEHLIDDIEHGYGDDFSSAVGCVLDNSPNFEMFAWGLDIDPDATRSAVTRKLRERADFPISPKDPNYEAWILASCVYSKEQFNRHRCRERVGDMCKHHKENISWQNRWNEQRIQKRKAFLLIEEYCDTDDATPQMRELLQKARKALDLAAVVHRLQCSTCDRKFKATDPRLKYCPSCRQAGIGPRRAEERYREKRKTARAVQAFLNWMAQ
jgi:hypothetical protein